MRTFSRLGSGLVVVGCALVVACSSSSGGGGSSDGGTPPPPGTCGGAPFYESGIDSIAAIGENVDRTCASVASYKSMFKDNPAGYSCSSPLDCAPVCCPCPDGSHFAMATLCTHGVCAGVSDACCAVLGTPLRACGN